MHREAVQQALWSQEGAGWWTWPSGSQPAAVWGSEWHRPGSGERSWAATGNPRRNQPEHPKGVRDHVPGGVRVLSLSDVTESPAPRMATGYSSRKRSRRKHGAGRMEESRGGGDSQRGPVVCRCLGLPAPLGPATLCKRTGERAIRARWNKVFPGLKP